MRNAAAALLVAAVTAGNAGSVRGFMGENATFVGTDLVGLPTAIGADLVVELDVDRGLVRDYADPGSPAWIGAFNLTAGIPASSIFHDGLLLALHTAQFGGATLIDLADPAAPVVLTSEFPSYYYPSAVLFAETVYLTSAQWLLVYDLADPANPTFATALALETFDGNRWPSRNGDRLYLLDGNATVRVIDSSQPAHPELLGTFALATQRIDAMAAAAGHLYVLQADAATLTLATYDLADPLAPRLTDSRVLLAGANPAGTRLEIADQTLYVATSADQLLAFSLALPSHPVPGFALPYGPEVIALTQHALLLRDDDRMLVLSRTPFDEPPVVLSERQALPRLDRIRTNGLVSVAVADHDDGLLVLDISDPATIALASRSDLPVQLLAMEGDLVAVCLAREFRLLNVTDPAHPKVLSQTRYPFEDIFLSDCALSDGLLAISFPSHGTVLFDVSDPTQPRQTNVMRQVHGKVRLEGPLMLTVTGVPLRAAIYDVSDPTLPSLLGQLPPQGVRDAALNRGLALVLNYSGLALYHVNGPGDFDLVGRVAVPGTSWLEAAGGRVYAMSGGVAYIVDVTDPAAPAIVGEFSGDSPLLQLAAAGGIVHTYMGLRSFLVQDETWTAGVSPADAPTPATRLLAPVPNPCNPTTTISFVVDRTEPVRLTVHDLRGRLVAVLAEGVFTPGLHAVTWRGADRGGRLVASGVYLIRLAGATGAQSQRVTLLR